jgi:hypothetical protein
MRADASTSSAAAPPPPPLLAAAASAPEVVLSGFIFKGTRHSDFVVKRQVFLFRDKLWTLHPGKSAREHKSWYLDGACTLSPPAPDAIATAQKLVRPPRKWTAVAAFQGRGQPVELFTLRVAWPTHHARLLLGFEQRSEAERWHAQIAEQIRFVHARRAAAAAGCCCRCVPSA